MCGFTGFWQLPAWSDQRLQDTVRMMSVRLSHRGPDGNGEWCDESVGFALGHTRLAIQDLTSEGHQPMVSSSQRYIIAYNGEVYNASLLRCELESEGFDLHWRGHSDTETMLACIERWGLEGSVKKFIGMFAFALWDRQERTLHLVRDRLGIKPLYYGFQKKSFLFGSQLNALRTHPSFQHEICREALSNFFKYNAVPAPFSIYQDIFKLLPGTILTLKTYDSSPHFRSYWDSFEISAQNTTFAGTYNDAVEELEVLLRDSVKLRMIADVPLGTFLSGGIDSSTVTALMQSQSDRPVKSFSIGFEEQRYNEAPYASEIAKYLGTDHSELIVTSQQAMDVIPKLPFIFDEPFSDSSQIPTFLVSELARSSVTVSLSGDGGDEIFAGYNRHIWGGKIWSKASVCPEKLRYLFSQALTFIHQEKWNKCFNLLNPLLPNRFRLKDPGRHFHDLARYIYARTPEEFYSSIVSHWTSADALLIDSPTNSSFLTKTTLSSFSSFTEWMMASDLGTYLPDDILTKVDRSSMAVSLEARVPLLDHRVVEFAWSLPLTWKLQGTTGKRILRDVLNRYVPAKLVERPKMGFGVPIEHWLRNELRDWAEDLLNESKIRQQGFLNPTPIRKRWSEHLSTSSNWQYHLWDVLMWQTWLENQR